MDRLVEARESAFIDTADVYPISPADPDTAGLYGRGCGTLACGQGNRRERFVLATKCRMRVGHGSERSRVVAPPYFGSMRSEPPAPENRRHRPVLRPFARPRDTRLDESLSAPSTTSFASGKVRYIWLLEFPRVATRPLSLGVSERSAPAPGSTACSRHRPPVPRGGNRASAALPRPGDRCCDLQPDRRRHAEREARKSRWTDTRNPVHARISRQPLPRSLLARRPVRRSQPPEGLLRRARYPAPPRGGRLDPRA